MIPSSTWKLVPFCKSSGRVLPAERVIGSFWKGGSPSAEREMVVPIESARNSTKQRVTDMINSFKIDSTERFNISRISAISTVRQD
jgi:hypothetical protein